MSELVQKINRQQDLAQKIRDLQSEERKLRADILQECFGEGTIGSVKTQVENVIVTGTYGLTYSFNQAEIEEALECDALSADAQEAIRVKFDVDKKKYDALDDDASAELDDYIIVKPSLPSIKIKFIQDEDDE